jgi:DHA2 family multidrug resistance protein
MFATETIEGLFLRFGERYRWYVAVVGMCGAAWMLMSATLVNVAVPQVMGTFGVGPDQVQWMATAFLATMTASQLLNAWMIAALGQRLAFTMTLAVFAVGSVVSATAPTMEVLVVGRIMQGFAAGIVQPLVMVTMFQVFPPNKRGLAMGVFGTGVVLAPGLGPTVAGALIDAFSWRAMFLLPLPFVAVSLLAGLVVMPNPPRAERLPRFDWTGYALLCLALYCLMTGLAHGPRHGWSSDHVLTMLGGGALAGTGFVWWQIRTGGRLLAVELFRNPVFSAAVFVAFIFGAGNFGSTYVIPVFVQEVQGYTATRAGAVMAPAAIVLAAMLPFTGRLADTIPGYLMVLSGLAAFAVGTALMMTSDVNTPFWTFAFFAVISRAGLGFILPSLSSTALGTLAAAELPKGSGNMNFIRQLGGASGTNLIVVWLQMQTSYHGDALAATQTAANTTSVFLLSGVRELLAPAGLGDSVREGVALSYLSNIVLAQAETFAFQDCFLALAAVFAFAMLPAWLLGRAQRRTA